MEVGSGTSQNSVIGLVPFMNHTTEALNVSNSHSPHRTSSGNSRRNPHINRDLLQILQWTDRWQLLPSTTSATVCWQHEWRKTRFKGNLKARFVTQSAEQLRDFETHTQERSDSHITLLTKKLGHLKSHIGLSTLLIPLNPRFWFHHKSLSWGRTTNDNLKSHAPFR